MNKECEYHDMLHRVWNRALSVDDAMDDVRDLIAHINELRNAAIDCIDYGETDALDFAVWRARDFADSLEGEEE